MKPAVYIKGIPKTKSPWGIAKSLAPHRRRAKSITLFGEVNTAPRLPHRRRALSFEAQISSPRYGHSGGRQPRRRTKAKGLFEAMIRVSQKAVRAFGEAARVLQKIKGLIPAAVRIPYKAAVSVLKKAVIVFQGLRCRASLRLPARSKKMLKACAGAIAAAAAAAAACVWLAGGESENTVLNAQPAVPTPIALYWPEPSTTTEPAKTAEPERIPLYAIAPKEELIETAKADTETVYVPENKMSAEEMFAEEFPGEDYGRTKKILARIIHGEAKGTKSVTNRAAIVETVLNRVDAGMGATPYKCAKAKHQFCIGKTCTEKELWIAEDVLTRWLKIRRGEEAGWILPKDYLWYYGTWPRHDWTVFRNKYYFKSGPDYMTPLHSEIYGD